MAEPLLAVRNLKTFFFTPKGVAKVLDGLTFDLQPGQIMGLVGETGSGKSVSAASILRLLKRPGRVVGGEIWFGGRNLLKISDEEMHQVRGKEIAMIFQNARAALNPLFTIGDLLTQVVTHHQRVSMSEARRRAVELLRLVHIADPERRLDAYPHQLSGGMCQRAMIALAVSCNPKLLIADEPTTGLDVTTQYQVVQLLKEMRNKVGTAIIAITHDLGLALKLCDVIAVMYLGSIAEWGTAQEVFHRPRHPYTQGLLRARPKLGHRGDLAVLPGSVPDSARRPSGCPFRTRCAFAIEHCERENPRYYVVSPSHRVACHRWEATA